MRRVGIALVLVLLGCSAREAPIAEEHVAPGEVTTRSAPAYLGAIDREGLRIVRVLPESLTLESFGPSIANTDASHEIAYLAPIGEHHVVVLVTPHGAQRGTLLLGDGASWKVLEHDQRTAFVHPSQTWLSTEDKVFSLPDAALITELPAFSVHEGSAPVRTSVTSDPTGRYLVLSGEQLELLDRNTGRRRTVTGANAGVRAVLDDSLTFFDYSGDDRAHWMSFSGVMRDDLDAGSFFMLGGRAHYRSGRMVSRYDDGALEPVFMQPAGVEQIEALAPGRLAIALTADGLTVVSQDGALASLSDNAPAVAAGTSVIDASFTSEAAIAVGRVWVDSHASYDELMRVTFDGDVDYVRLTTYADGPLESYWNTGTHLVWVDGRTMTSLDLRTLARESTTMPFAPIDAPSTPPST